MKARIKRLLKRLGFEVRRTNIAASSQYPYIESFKMNEIEFDYWITNDTYRNWYNPSVQAGWCINEGYLKYLRPSDKVLEIGCNAGFTTCLLSRAVGPTGLVVGLDIIPSNCMVAASQIGLNHIANARILNKGAGETKGKLIVNNRSNGTVSAGAKRDDEIEVEIVRCDDLIPEYGHFDVLKVDVEGFESHVFKGARELLAKRPRLLLEIHGADVEKYGSSYEELFSLIDARNYEGIMCMEPNNKATVSKLEPFDLDRILATKSHGNLFIQPRA